MSLVVDASVALKWVLPEAGSDAADRLLDEGLLAPDLWLIEAANALCSRTARGELAPDEAQSLFAKLQKAPVVAAASPPLLTQALALAQQLRHPVYDCLYLALAISEQTTVVTADRRFHTVIQDHPALAGRVRLLGE